MERAGQMPADFSCPSGSEKEREPKNKVRVSEAHIVAMKVLIISTTSALKGV